jgi:dTDP-4-dehydrorhamnose 3,5-epimerase
LKFTETNITDCYLLEPEVYQDHRGTFFESYNKREFDRNMGKPVDFVQDNHSISKRGVLRGLHFQTGSNGQAKLVRVAQGEVLDVIVDIRKESTTFGQQFQVLLSAENRKMLFIPRGIAHGFLALENHTVFIYKCDNYYSRESEGGLVYNDPDLGIDWGFPEDQMLLSDKDRQLPRIKDLSL